MEFAHSNCGYIRILVYEWDQPNHSNQPISSYVCRKRVPRDYAGQSHSLLWHRRSYRSDPTQMLSFILRAVLELAGTMIVHHYDR